MSDVAGRLTLIARAWDEAAQGYEEYFVPRFAPWVADAVGAVTETPLPPGPILVPCCGTFPELPALIEAFPDREIIGVDLSAEMVRLARERAAGLPHVWAVEGNAATLGPEWFDACAGVVSVFGLQQLPDPVSAVTEWVRALRAGGRISVTYWPSDVEDDGPFALVGQILDGSRRGDDSWEGELGDAITAGGATVERDEYRSFPMQHRDAETFWTAMTSSGPLRALALDRGEPYMEEVRATFLAQAPAGPWHHRPRARRLVAGS